MPGTAAVHRFATIRDNVASKAAANAAPQLRLLEPADGTTVPSGAPVRFSAGVADDDAAPADVVWTSGDSSKTGGSLELSLADGVHEITATVTDGAGQTGRASVTVTRGSGSSTEPDPSPAGTTIPVGGLWRDGDTDDSAANHDPSGDQATITVTRP